jgi:Acyl-CoA synthetases (AMP-forming)/AMP-acid ligases II
VGRHLPDYMVPVAFVAVDELPLTANGKLDRRALPAPDYVLEDFAPPETPLEVILCDLFGELTGRDEVGATANFFSLGGDSIQVIRLVGRGRQHGFGFGVRDVFRHPTPRALAALTGQGEDVVIEVTPGSGALGDGQVALSHGQKRMWILSQIEGQDVAYNMPGVFHLTSKIDGDLLEQSVRFLMERHQVLRTLIGVDREGSPVGFLKDLPQDPLVAMRHVEKAECNNMIQAEAAKKFDLGRDFPLRVTLLDAGQTDNYLLVTLHHHAADEHSVDLLLKELGAIYTSLAEGSKPSLPNLASLKP